MGEAPTVNYCQNRQTLPYYKFHKVVDVVVDDDDLVVVLVVGRAKARNYLI